MALHIGRGSIARGESVDLAFGRRVVRMSDRKYISPRGISECSAIVAGAASGIGQAVAARLAALGAKVMLLDRDAASLAKAVSVLDDAGFEVAGASADLGEPAAVARAVYETRERYGSLDVAVNSVGITGQTGRRSHDVELEDFDHVVAVNLRAAFVFSQQVLPVMLEQRYGRVLHVASIAGKEGNPGMVAYSASKAGLIGMVKSQGKEYARDGITVNALSPAVIWTPLVEAMPERQVAYMTEKIPMGRLGSLEEAATIVEFIVSPHASFCTGVTFDLSGGRATY